MAKCLSSEVRKAVHLGHDCPAFQKVLGQQVCQPDSRRRPGTLLRVLNWVGQVSNMHGKRVSPAVSSGAQGWEVTMASTGTLATSTIS